MLKLCLILFISLVACGTIFIQEDWRFRPGVEVPSGSQTHSFKGADGRLLTVKGYRRITGTEESAVSVYHAIIFYPTASFIGGGSTFSQKGNITTETQSWKLQKNPPSDFKNVEEKLLEIKYDSLEKTLAIGSETFDTKKGNLFVIRLDNNWLPSTQQIPARSEESATGQEVLDLFKSILGEERAIQRLELY